MLCAKSEIFEWPGIRDADEVINVGQEELHELVGEDGVQVGKAKQGVVGEDSFASHQPTVDHAFSTKTTVRLWGQTQQRRWVPRLALKATTTFTQYHIILEMGQQFL